MAGAAGARRSMLCAVCAAALLARAQPTGHETEHSAIRESAAGLFSVLDANRNGMLNKVELLQREGVAISDVRALGIAVEDGVEGLLQACDGDGNRAISEEELWVRARARVCV